ncbi:hypothetical protein [Treponema sp.]|uniref:hypothetical protein n=1 Tax=Treponema sp. TaxID=166 RepID=UPI0038911707
MKKNCCSFLKIFVLLFFTFKLFSQNQLRTVDLKSLSPSWQAVIGGEAVSPCVDTSYGVALVSDGRLLSACTSSGNVIWQRSIKGRPTKYISSFGDFLYVVTDLSSLSLINPSGMTLWTAKCQFNINDFPLVGNDGRVFVKGSKSIACYGLDGKRKWFLNCEELASFPLLALEDGSILAILKKTSGGKSLANRYSPFGRKIEDITFSNTVSTALSCEQGVLISLKNGSIGLVTLKENSAVSKWVNGSGNTAGSFKICYSAKTENSAFFFQNGNKTEAVIVKTESGEILNRFQVGQIAPKDFQIAKPTQSGFFISGIHTACEFNENGTILYAAQLPQKNIWNSIAYTDKNYLILCMKDWSMKAYLMNQLENSKIFSVSSKNHSISYVKSKKVDSVSLGLGIRPLNVQKMTEISQAFSKGDYGENEEEYLSLIKTEAENYISSYATLTVFQSQNKGNFFAENAVYTQNLLYLMAETGTREFSVYFARLLQTQTDLSQLSSIIAFAGSCGYDEDGQMLSALENLVVNKIKPSQTAVLKSICDSTYEICRYMGRPALNRQGKNILSHLFYPQYDKSIRDYSRNVLSKMIELEKK